MEVRTGEEDLIPCVGQVVLPSVSNEGWIIDHNLHSLLYCPGESM